VLLHDIVDNVARENDYAVFSLGAAGDTVAGMVQDSEYIGAIRQEMPDAFLLSACGNDLLGEGRLTAVLKPYTPGMSAAEIIDHNALDGKFSVLLSDYAAIVETALRARDGLTVFGHGYGYAKPVEGGKWLGRPLAEAGIPLDLGEEVVRHIVDRFNDELAALPNVLGKNFIPLDVRGLVGESTSSWHDELHPKNPGFARVSKPFLKALEKIAVLPRVDGMESAETFAPGPGKETISHGVESTSGLVVLDAGHGGFNPPAVLGGSSWNNAMGPNGTLEKILTLDVAKRTREILQAHGYKVLMTRTGDVNLGLAERAGVAKQAKAAVFVSIHFNASTGHNAQGTETFVHNNHSQASRRLCRAVQSKMVASLGMADRNASHPGGIKKARYGVLMRSRHAPETACVLHEVSFLDRSAEEARLASSEYRQSIAQALVLGIEDYMGGGIEGAFASIDPDGIGDAIELAALENGQTVLAYLGAAEDVMPAEARPVDGEFQMEHQGGHMIAGRDGDMNPHAHPASVPQTSGDVVESILASFAIERGSPAHETAWTDQDDIDEFSVVPIGNVIDFNQMGFDGPSDRQALISSFAGVESSGFSFPEFEAHIQSLGLRHFKAVEFLVMGASNAPGGSCSGKNTLPPKSLWREINNTARMLDEIRERLGAPIRILSCYRSPEYNKCIKGKSGSLHKQFNAVDWRCDQGSVADWHSVARSVRAADSRFTGGIGRYDSQRFIHADTRGYNANW